MSKNLEVFKIISDLLEYKLELLSQIYDLTRLQCEKIEKDNVDKLLNLINSKQRRIDKIKNIDIRYSNILNKNNVKELREIDFDGNLFLELEDKEKKIKELASQIYRMEQHNEKVFREKFDIMKQNLKSLRNTKKVTSNYYKIPTQVGGYFVDNKK